MSKVTVDGKEYEVLDAPLKEVPPHPGQIKKDATNPDYYKNKPIEIIDCIASITYGKDGFGGFLVGQVVKYVARYNEKNGLEDLKKAKWYLDMLITRLEKEEK
jgi:hypothetical protein